MSSERDCTDSSLIKFIFAYDRNDSPGETNAAVERRHSPSTPQEAEEELFTSNKAYAGFIADCRSRPDAPIAHSPVCVRLTPREVGLDGSLFPGFPKQKPFAAFLGCVDARAPVEVVFAQGFVDLYTMRIAGNTLGPDCVASLHYALHKMAPLQGTPQGELADKTLRLVVALGHADCGAVTAAVDTHLGRNDISQDANEFLVDDTVRGLLGRIHLPSVHLAAKAMPEAEFGTADHELYRKALVELAVYVNAAWSGHDMKAIVSHYHFAENTDVQVRYGVFDPRDCLVRTAEAYRFAPGGGSLVPPQNAQDALKEPPSDLPALYRLAQTMAAELKRQHASGDEAKSLRQYFGVA